MSNYIQTSVTINMDGETEMSFSLKGKHYKIDLPAFDTDFHEFDFQGEDFNLNKFYDGVLKSETIADIYDEFDPTFFPPELIEFRKLS